ncbi:PE-PPE domain-containing protein, partial [Mycolicibacterium fortuitum]|nr:PE-PPE domain-containing protein [Mycolicibacterium fortuitum]MDV7208606.1 PE-PPE domain-containing protein [Mycolicibacterium fortuitum]MDV7228563.1 PE-PPE domain-containing protein [Mycolicibacterium fortuitum]MDV7260936.1 PE-PPE domain-containing protein [Mycolicibacterium fortuitum]MDV7286045.1 PE-PPE domain-containing protein [Mycolicibacterium fortuitum]
DPSQVKEFGWVTPPEKIHEALNALPAAFEQSLAILGGEKYTPTLPQPVVSGTQPETPVTEHPIDPVGTSPVEQGVRHTVEDVAAALSDATRPLAKVLQAIGGATAPHKTVDPADSTVEAVGETGEQPTSTPVSRNPRPRSEASGTDSAPRLRVVRDTDDSDTRTPAPKPVPGKDRPDRTSVRAAAKHAAKEATKSAEAKRDRPAKRQSAKAG